MIGMNCSVGPEISFEVLEKMRDVTVKPLSVQPNAGMPRQVEGRNLYMATPEYFAEYAKRFALSGAKIVGGCCGTTPDHIRAMRNAIKAVSPKASRATVARDIRVAELGKGSDECPIEARSGLAARITSGDFVTTVELIPPRGADMSRMLASARRLMEHGVNAVNIPDGPRASARMSPMAAAVKISQEVSIEPLLHYTCRDRNLLGMQSDMLGAHALNLRNMLLVTGDPPKIGDYPDATAVFDVDAIGLTNMVSRLNRGLDLGGNRLKTPTSFFVGVGVNPGAIDLEHELSRFRWKVDAGAHFAITQPVFDVALFERCLVEIEKRDLCIPIIAGIWPLLSLRNAEFMNNEIPGARVPDSIMQRMADAKTDEDARLVGVEIAREILDGIRPMIQGVQVSPPLGKVSLALSVLEM